MRFRGVLLTLVVLLAVLFSVVNWPVVVTSVPVNLLIVTVQLPLGLVLLTVAVGLSLIFFATALFDRATQLRRVTQLERQIEGLQAKMDQRRLEEVAQLEQALHSRCDALDEQFGSGLARLEEVLGERLDAAETRTQARLEDVKERVLLVRNELAADIAEAEDSLSRRVTGEEVEPP